MDAAPSAKPKFKSLPLILPNSYNYDPATNAVTKSDRKVTGLKAMEEGLRILSSIRGPVAVISIVGAYRKGKSYFLSRLLGSNNAFELGASSDPKTIGIWIGTQTIPHKTRNADGSEVDCTVVLIDTEGLDSVQGDQHRDNAIFMLSVMLSSLMIYNNAGVPTEKDLDSMAFILKTVRSFAVRAGGKAGDGDVKEYFPDLLWLLRDFHLDLVKDGAACTADEYLRSVLRQSEGASDEDERRNSIRKAIHFFRTQHLATVPHPGVDPETLKHLEDVPIERLPAHFNKDLEAAKAKALSLVATKRAPASTGGWVTASGDLVAAFLLELVKAVNEPNTVPILEPMYQQAFRSAMSKTLDRAALQYRNSMDKFVSENQLPVESNVLMDASQKATDASLQLFQKEVPACDPKLVTEYGTRLVQLIADFGASDSARKPEVCRLWTEPPSQPKKWTSQAEEHMVHWCESVGFKVLPMPPDGNCGFHAYLKLMTDAEKTRLKVTDVESLRRVLADAMAGPLLERLRTLPNFAGEDLRARVERVRSGGASGAGPEYWAGEDTHLALAFLLERPVTVVTCFDSLRPLVLPHPSSPKDWDPSQVPSQEQLDRLADLSSNALFVLYLHGNHYSALERAPQAAKPTAAEAPEGGPLCPKCKKEKLRPGTTFCNACHEAVAAPRHVELKKRLNEALNLRKDEEARKRDARAAVEELTKAIAADASDADLYHLRGEAYSVLGERDNAIKDWDEALRRQRSVKGGMLYEYVVRNEKASEQQCQLVLERLYKPIHEAVAKGDITFAEFEQRVERLREEYDREGRGPMKGIAASKFIARILQQDGELLKNLRGYREEAKVEMQKRNEADAKAQAAEDRARVAAEQRDRVALQQKEEMKLLFQQQQAMQENMMKEMRNAAEKDRERAAQLQKAMLEAQAENAKRQAEQQEKMVTTMQKMMADAQKQHQEALEKMVQAIKSMPPPQVHVSGGCLLSDAVVRLRDGRRVLLGAVRVGDWVESADGAGRCVYSQVFFNATHRSTARVVTVTACDPRDLSQPHKRLELTDDHLLYVSPAEDATRPCGSPVAAGKVQVGAWVWARDEGETVLRPWRITAVTAQERPCMLQNVLVLNNCLVADGMLASCFTINHTWELLDSLPLRALFYARPSLLESAAVQKAVHSYDTVVEGAVKYALSWLGV